MCSPETLVSLDKRTQTYKFHHDVLENMFLPEKTGRHDLSEMPVAVVSIGGLDESGKSFILNFFLRYLQTDDQTDWIGFPDEPLRGFHWGNRIDLRSKSILIWPELFIVRRKDGKKIAVILIDTDEYSDQIFGLCTWISSMQIYNLQSEIDLDDLIDLIEPSKFGSSLHGSEENDRKALGKLVFLIRDWERVEHKCGLAGGREYLRKNKEDQIDQSLKLLDNFYSYIDCFLMPTLGEDSFDAEFDGMVSELNQEFITNLEALVPSILSPENIVIKTWQGDELSLEGFTNFFKRIAFHYEDNRLVQIGDMFNNRKEKELVDAMSSTRKLYLKLARKKLNMVQNVESMDEIFVNCRNKALSYFHGKMPLIDIIDYQAEDELMEFFESFEKDYLSTKGWIKSTMSVQRSKEIDGEFAARYASEFARMLHFNKDDEDFEENLEHNILIEIFFALRWQKAMAYFKGHTDSFPPKSTQLEKMELVNCLRESAKRLTGIDSSWRKKVGRKQKGGHKY